MELSADAMTPEAVAKWQELFEELNSTGHAALTQMPHELAAAPEPIDVVEASRLESLPTQDDTPKGWSQHGWGLSAGWGMTSSPL